MQNTLFPEDISKSVGNENSMKKRYAQKTTLRFQKIIHTSLFTNTMGNYIVGPMIEQQKAMQQEMQQNQLKSQERMIRKQLAFQLAFRKDLLHWMGTAYGLVVFGATAATIKQKKFPPLAAIPLLFGGLVLAYNYDFVYGDKLNRVDKYYQEILKDESQWFIPIEVKAREAKGKPVI